MKCGGVFGDESMTCDDILDEDCIMETDPGADFSHGATDPFNCAEHCAMDNFPFYVFTMEDGRSSSICHCFSSSARTCFGLNGPPEPRVDSC